jgi:hypothetical protein
MNNHVKKNLCVYQLCLELLDLPTIHSCRRFGVHLGGNCHACSRDLGPKFFNALLDTPPFGGENLVVERKQGINAGLWLQKGRLVSHRLLIGKWSHILPGFILLGCHAPFKHGVKSEASGRH